MKKIFISLLNPIRNMENESYNFKLGFIKCLIPVLIWLFLDSFFFIFAYSIFDETFIDNNYIIIGLVEFISIPLIAFILENTFGRKKWEYNTYKKVNLKLLLCIALLVLVFRLLYDAYIFPLLDLIPDVALSDSSDENIIYFVFSACICAPLIEEIIFRGIITNGLLKKYSPKVAIILSSLIFAIAHLNLKQGINAFLMGLILAYIYYKTKSIYLTMFAHFTNNILACFLIIPAGGLLVILLNITISTAISIPLIRYIRNHLVLTYEANFISTLSPAKKIFRFNDDE